MICETLPEDPRERKAIILLRDVDIVLSYNTEWIKSPNITVIEYPFDSDSPIFETELYKSLERANLIEPDAILSQSPYDLNAYADATKFEDLICSNALNKCDLFTRFCRKLGATKFSGIHFENEQNTMNKDLGGNSGYKVAEASAQMNRDLESKLSQELKLEDTYDGDSNPNIEEAKQFLIDNHIFHDKVFTSLLEARIGSGKIKSRNISFSMTSESMQSLKIIGGIKLAFFNADGNYANKIHTLKDIKISLNIEFGKG